MADVHEKGPGAGATAGRNKEGKTYLNWMWDNGITVGDHGGKNNVCVCVCVCDREREKSTKQ